MNLLSLLRPNQYLVSIGSIDLLALREKYDTLVFDVDNSVCNKGECQLTEEAVSIIGEALDLGFKIVFLSNVVLSDKGRIARVAQICGEHPSHCAILPGVKPFARAYHEALALVGSSPETSVMVGDQLFTDVLGGNWCGLFTVLLKPLGKDQHWSTAIKRWPERLVLRLFKLTPA